MEGNRKKPERNPVRRSHGWAKEIAARARLERAGDLDGYATGMSNDIKGGEE